jgi:hypothetical protein
MRELGRCKVLEWSATDMPSRSVPGTRQVCLSLKLQTRDGITHTAKVWWTPEHPNDLARQHALQVGRRLGLSERKCSARRLAASIDLARPEEVDAVIDDKGFWRITW